MSYPTAATDPHHHHHRHSQLSKDSNCASCCKVTVTKPYPLPCICCFPTPGVTAPHNVYESMFGCCPPPLGLPLFTHGHSDQPKHKSKSHHHHHHKSHHHQHDKNPTSSSSSAAAKDGGSKKSDPSLKDEATKRTSPPESARLVPQPQDKEPKPESPHKQPNKVFAPISHIYPSKANGVTDAGPKSSSSSPHLAMGTSPLPTAPDGSFQGLKSSSPQIALAIPPSSSPAIVRPTAFTAVCPQPRKVATPNVPMSESSATVESSGRSLSCSPPKLAKLSVGDVATSKKQSGNSDGCWKKEGPVDGCKKEKNVLNRVWEANYSTDSARQVSVVLAVTPVDVKTESSTPAEATTANVAKESANQNSNDGSKSTLRSENVISPLVTKAATSVPFEPEKNGWKRTATDSLLNPAPSAAKKMKKKDVIVISMKDEHQISSNLVMKSVKRKLEEPKVSADDQKTSINHQFPAVNDASSMVHSSSVLTTTTTTTTAMSTISCVTETTSQGNSNCSSDASSILKVKSMPSTTGFGEEANKTSHPLVGITLTKTSGDNGLYKSSVLQTPLITVMPSPASSSDFNSGSNAARLRKYYEEQKLKLQQAEEFNQLRFTQGSSSGSSSSVKDTLAPSTTPLPTFSLISALSSKPKPSVFISSQSSPSSLVLTSKQGTAPTQLHNSIAKTKTRTLDEAANDGDDERDDDEDEEEDDEYDDDDDDDEDYESDEAHKNARKRPSVPNGSLEKSMTPSIKTSSSKSPLPVTPSTGHKNDSNSKRVMYNKALGETMLHRAARLGQMDHLKYYLDTQYSTIDARDNAGYSPLHECCSRGHIEAARMLLQYGADVNSYAAGGVRPIHDAVENDYLEIVRLLLSYGADPLIATYSGSTPVKMARSPAMIEFFKGFLADVSGECVTPILPWQFKGSAKFFDVKPSGYDPMEELPSDDEIGHHHSHSSGSGVGNGVVGGGGGGNDECDVDDDAALIFEVSDKPHIPTYHVPTQRPNSSGVVSFCLLQDVLNQTGMNRGAFLACYPDIQVERMAREEFLNNAKCTQIMVDPSAALGNSSCHSSHVELVHWNANLRDILDIERVCIPATAK